MGAVYFLASFFRLSQYSAVYIFCDFAVEYYHAVRKLPVLRGPPYNPNIYPSHLFNFALVIWNALYITFVFIAFFAAVGLKDADAPGWEISCGLVDFTHALFMLVAARVQQTFLPEQSWRGNCTDAYNWGVSGGETGFYTLISITVDNGNMTQSGAMAQCEKYESAWLIEEIMGGIALLTGFLSVVYPVYRLLRPPISFILRYARTKQNATPIIYDRGSIQPLNQTEQTVLKPNEFPSGEKPTLPSLIANSDNDYSILRTIAAHSHYTDMKSLQLACRATRAAMKSEILMRESCINGSKSECWGCLTQVCEDCQTSKTLPPPATTTHLENCQPYCSKCNFSRHYAPGGWEVYRDLDVCMCEFRPKYYWRRPDTNNVRILCRRCSELSDDEVRKMRAKREKAEMEHLLQWPLRCAKCNAYLDGKSPCWWGCTSCSKICEWDGHPSKPPHPQQ